MNRVDNPRTSGRSAVPLSAASIGRILAPGESVNSAPRVLLLGGCRLVRDDCSLRLSGGTQRLLAFLALQGRAARRDLMTGALWSDVSEDRARGSLRSALARFGEIAADMVAGSAVEVSLAAGVSVDLDDGQLIAHRLLESSCTMGPVAAVEAAARARLECIL